MITAVIRVHPAVGDDDEIIFVDYNTPDDFPTFPEAIQDTLTERAKKLLEQHNSEDQSGRAIRKRKTLAVIACVESPSPIQSK